MCRIVNVKYHANWLPQVLAVGFLLVILSCALYHQYLPLLEVATYVIAPMPNWICGRLANPDDFGGEGSGSALLDFGKFVTGGLVVMGIGTSIHSIFSWRPWKCVTASVAETVEMKEEECMMWIITELLLTFTYSSANRSGTLRNHHSPGNDNVHCRRSPHLQHHCYFRHVFPRGAGLLRRKRIRNTRGQKENKCRE